MTPHLQPLTSANDAGGGFKMPADGYFMLAPIGEFPHSDSGFTQVIDAAAVAAMANSFQPGDELLVDFEHESHNPDKRTMAAGWIQGLLARPDGLFAKIKWSREGAEAVQGGAYRYISPVWLASDCETISDKRVRPLRLHDAGLTNRPNLQGIAALSNRGAANAALATAEEFARVPVVDALQEFHALVNQRRETKNESFYVAYENTKRTHREAYEKLLNAHVVAPGTALEEKLRNRGAFAGGTAGNVELLMPSTIWPNNQCPIYTWENAVKAIQAKQRITFDAAWSRARVEKPNEWTQYVSECERLESRAEDKRSGVNRL